MDDVSSPVQLAPDALRLWQQVNDTAADIAETTVGRLLAQSLRRWPDRTAVITAQRRLRYRELGALAHAVAQQLDGAPAAAVCVEPGWEQVVALVAAALAGTPLRAIDPAAAQPARWQHAPAVVLSQSWLRQRLRWPEGTRCLDLDTVTPTDLTTALDPGPAGSGDSWWYLQPGAPGGDPLPVSHRAVVDVLTDLIARFGIGESDRTLLVSPPGDPAALSAAVTALLAGGAVVVPDGLDLHSPPAWFELAREHAVTIWHASPTLTALLAEHLSGRAEALPCLRLALLGGEPLAPSVVRRLRAVAPGMRVANLGAGGPAGLWATCHEIGPGDPADRQVPIGRPLANRRTYLLSDALAPTPVWVTGRLHVGGRGTLATDVTLPDGLPGAGQALHRTAFTGRLLPDGTIEITGDDAARTTVHGHPLNLREVQALLAEHPAVLLAAVVAHGGGSTAYVKLAAGQHATGAQLLEHLRGKMSPYLLPSAVELVATFALTPSGLLDRSALATGSLATAAPVTAEPETVGSAGTGQPQPLPAELVRQACRLAARVLGLADVEPSMNLLDLGATSIQLVRLATRAEQELGLAVDIDELLRFPSVTVLVSSAQPALAETAPTEITAEPDELIMDPVQRLAFKDRHHGLRHDLDDEPAIALAPPDAELMARLAARRTHREFDPAPVPVAALATLLAALCQLNTGQLNTGQLNTGQLNTGQLNTGRLDTGQLDSGGRLDGSQLDGDEPRHAYPSAGSLFPVQVYLTVSDGRVESVAAGAYYHDPLRHRLVALAPEAAVPAAAHAWINRPAFRASAFCLYLVADLAAITPMYGQRARDYCLIEAGAMCQLLMTVAAGAGLGLCPVGELDDAALRGPLRLGAGQELVHALLGGAREWQ